MKPSKRLRAFEPETGTRPRIDSQTCPATPLVSAMTQHMRQISHATAGRQLMAQAGSDTAVTLAPTLFTARASMELIRQHCLSNRVFSGYDEIVDEVSKAWNHFISIPDRVKKMCNREWIELI